VQCSAVPRNRTVRASVRRFSRETFWTIEQTYCNHRANLLYCIVTVTETVTSRGLRANSDSLTVSVLNGDSLTVFCLTVSVLNGDRNGNTKSNSSLLLYVLSARELVVFATRLRSVV